MARRPSRVAQASRLHFAGAAGTAALRSAARPSTPCSQAGRPRYCRADSLAKFGLGFGMATAFDFNQLVNDAERGNVARSGKVRADAPNVNGRALADELGDAEFVQVATGDDLGLGEAVAIEDLPHLAALLEKVAAVEPHPGDLAPKRCRR